MSMDDAHKADTAGSLMRLVRIREMAFLTDWQARSLIELEKRQIVENALGQSGQSLR